MTSEQGNRRAARFFFRRGLAVWFVLVLILASGALVLRFCEAGWVDLFERQRMVRNFMANPLELVIVEGFGTL